MGLALFGVTEPGAGGQLPPLIAKLKPKNRRTAAEHAHNAPKIDFKRPRIDFYMLAVCLYGYGRKMIAGVLKCEIEDIAR